MRSSRVCCRDVVDRDRVGSHPLAGVEPAAGVAGSGHQAPVE